MKAVSPVDIGTTISRLIALQGTLISVGMGVFSYVIPGWISQTRSQGAAPAPVDALADARMTSDIMWSYALILGMILLMIALLLTPVFELQAAFIGVLPQRTLVDIGCVAFAGTGASIVMFACLRRSE